MLVIPNKRKLVLNTKRHGDILAVIPHAKTFTHKGTQLVAMNHGVEESLILRNLGYRKTPAPILSYYDFPARFEAMAHQKATAAFLTNNKRALCLNAPGCVDADTEYLSPTGWNRIADYKDGLVAQFEPTTNQISFVSGEYVKVPCDTMLKVKTKYGIDQLLSPEHRCLMYSKLNKNKLHEVISAEELNRREYSAIPRTLKTISFSQMAIKTTFNYDGIGMPLSDAEMRVQIAVIADGHFPSPSTTRCIVRIKKERKKSRLRSLLNTANISYSERSKDYASAVGFTVFTFYAPTRDKIFNAQWLSCSQEQLNTVVDEVKYWDSHISSTPNRGWRFSSHAELSADFVQFACAATGNTARVLANKRLRRGKEEIEYVVQVRPSLDRIGLMGGSSNQITTWQSSTDGYKYCFMVPSTFLVLRRNGCIFTTGNTGKSLSALWAADYLMLEGIIKTVLIVAPLSTLKPVWGKELRHHFPQRNVVVIVGSRAKREQLIDSAGMQYAIINHDGFTSMQKHLSNKFDLIIYDECFVAGTLVSTPQGERPIEQLTVGEEVLTSCGVQRIKRLKCTTSSDLISLETSDGKRITCTTNHPFFTDAGWVTAENLIGRRLISADELSNMRKGVHIPEIEMAMVKKTPEKLRNELLNILQVEENQQTKSDNRYTFASTRDTRKSASNIFIKALRAVSRISRQNISNTQSKRSLPKSAWWKWHWHDTMRNANSRSAATSSMELYNSIGKEAARLSYKLQSGLCNPKSKDSARSRWCFSHYDRTKKTGQEKRSTLSGTWVVGITHHKQGNETTVYNLEIEGTPNYFAAGVLVHNCTALKTPTSQRYRIFAKWVTANNPWLWLMTGTPIAQNPTDAWTLSKLVGSPIVPNSFTAFKELVMHKISMFKWAARDNALDICKKVLQPSIRYSLDECKDLPPTIYLDHQSELSVDQARAFKSMQKDCVSVLSEGTATAANAAVMFSKLLQICTGAVYDENGDVLSIDATHRCDTLQEVINEIGGKCIVFVPFRGVQAYLYDMLTKAGHDVALVNGSVGKKERDDIFEAFQNSDKYTVLLAHPKVAAHGLTLTRAQDVIWFAPIYSLEQYEQACARIRRLNTVGKTRVHHLYSTKFEKELYDRLQHKRKTLGDFLELVRGTND